jgi:hypothetical protein
LAHCIHTPAYAFPVKVPEVRGPFPTQEPKQRPLFHGRFVCLKLLEDGSEFRRLRWDLIVLLFHAARFERQPSISERNSAEQRRRANSHNC